MPSPPLDMIVGRDKAFSYSNVSAMALLLYDFFQTLNMEIDYIWYSPFTVIKWSYLCMRCLQFICVIILVLGPDDHWSALSDGACLGLKIAYWGLALLAFGASELIITLRTWILCRKQRWIAMMLIMSNFILHIPGLTVISLTFASTIFDDIDIPDQLWVKCVLTSSFNKIWVSWLLLVIYDAALCILLVGRAYCDFKAKCISPSIMRIYREAIMYYLCIFAIDLIGLLPSVIYRDELLITSLPLIVRQLLSARIVLYSWKRAHINGDHKEYYTYALTTVNRWDTRNHPDTSSL